ncbi:hypothetical protein ACSYGW_09895 [Bacillus glycinifermentans]|uniref:hypothetical protein n=1 Tax=Bacillus glycinifermentans TaxID=1664069 RepID=UPI001FF17AC2|nr:hypothetical protein [Bacillus glycinifermentans]UOY90734.1 hypothetical protein MW696_02690 [Bacillus glycinifermentans]
MKYKYTIEYKKEFNEVILDFDIDKSLKHGYLISNSLGSDVFGDFSSVKVEVENLFKLILGKVSLYESGGNVNIIKSNKYFTTFEDIFSEEDEEDEICKIETLEYIKIILVWAKENILYKSQLEVVSKEEAELAVDWLEGKLNEINEFDFNS